MKILAKSWQNLAKLSTFERCKTIANLIDLENLPKMNIQMQRSALIQQRTDRLKFAGCWASLCTCASSTPQSSLRRSLCPSSRWGAHRHSTKRHERPAPPPALLSTPPSPQAEISIFAEVRCLAECITDSLRPIHTSCINLSRELVSVAWIMQDGLNLVERVLPW